MARIRLSSRIAPAPRARGAVCFTYDDSYASHHTASAMHSARGQRATFGVQTNSIDTVGRLSSAQILAMHQAGHEMAAHSVDHSNMLSLTSAQRVTQYDNAKAAVEAVIGAGACKTWIYPYGSSSAKSNATDRELYLRYERFIATTSGPSVIPMDDRAPVSIGRINWDGTAQSHQQVLDAIRLAARMPVIVGVYTHDIDAAGSATTAQLTEGLDLAEALDVPCLTLAEAFPSNQILADPGFEDASMYHWAKTESAGGMTAESVADTPDTGMAGTRSLHLQCTSASGFVYVTNSVRVPVVGGRQYSLTGKARVAITSGAGSVQLRVREYNYDSQTVVATTASSAITSTTWTTVQKTFTPQATTRTVLVECLINALNAEAWFDHIHYGLSADGELG